MRRTLLPAVALGEYFGKTVVWGFQAFLNRITEDRSSSKWGPFMTAISTTGAAAVSYGIMKSVEADTPSAPSDTASGKTPDSSVISLSKGTLATSVHPSDATAEQRVESLIDEVRTHNTIADAVARFDWAKFAQTAGSDKAEADREACLKYLGYSTARISREFGESGVNVQTVTDQQAAQNGIAPGSLLISSFSFKSGGSTYAVTAGTNGTLVGTRDSQPWKTWKTTSTHIGDASAGAATALSALQNLLADAKAGTTSTSAGLLHVTA